MLGFLDEDSLTFDTSQFLDCEDLKSYDNLSLNTSPHSSTIPLFLLSTVTTTTTTTTTKTTEEDLDSQSIVLLSANPRKRNYDGLQYQLKQRKRKKINKKTHIDENNWVQRKERERYHQFVASFNSSHKDIIERYALLSVRGKKPVINQITSQCCLGSELDIQVLSHLILNSSVSSQILQMKDVITGGTIKVTRSGCVKLFGLKSIQDCAYSMQKACSKIQEQHNIHLSEIHPNDRKNSQDIIQNIGEMTIVQITCSVNFGFPINLSKMEQNIEHEIQKGEVIVRHHINDYVFYDSEIKNYLSYYFFVDRKIDPEPGAPTKPNLCNTSKKPKKVLKNYITVQFYSSGRVLFMGVKFVEEINQCFKFVSDLCKQFVSQYCK